MVLGACRFAFILACTLSLALQLVNCQQPVPAAKDGLSREQLKTTGEKKQAIVKEKQEQQQAKPTTAKMQLNIQQAELSLIDADQDRTVKTIKLEYPGKPLTEKLTLSDRDKLIMLFRLQNTAGGSAPLSVNQVFLRLSHAEQPFHEVFAVAEPESSGLYKVDIQMQSMRSTDFKSINGVYKIFVDIGDANAEQSISWHVGKVEVAFTGGVDAAAAASARANNFNVRPEIKHTFRLPEKRPPAVVTTAFLVLALVPLGLLLILWAKIGVNLNNFPYTLPSLVFFGSLSAIFYLYFMFWTKLNMFQTLNWLALLGTIAFVSGGMLLRSMAVRRVKHD